MFRLSEAPLFRVSFLGRFQVAQGSIKKLVIEKGFGFIESQPNDMFFHHSVVEGTQFEELQEGQLVEFEFEDSPKGPRATLVRLSEG
jgi:CspA family cold shock protein